ncbi:MAG TPA: tRNA (guanosine(37)-N1)-methyltransferase TrmD [Acholeplasmataceae bacterium]|nr:tRNA (guanosine(37)-N1)-methyltransferase TrmD [Acholeplasmataceae bacterium]
MRIDILTLFPEMFDGVLNQSIIKRAREKGHVEINVINFRTFADNKHQKVDDTPYGGGAGMVLTIQPLVSCLESIPNFKSATKILTTPSGHTYNQNKAKSLSEKKHLIIICGHYEGIDERILNYIDEEISIGDYVLTGGEIAALAIIDSVIRLIPNVINKESITEESFSDNLLEYPQYTKPYEYKGLKVPDVLISGNHEEIRKFRRFEALKKTYFRRPDLLEKAKLNNEDINFLNKIKNE